VRASVAVKLFGRLHHDPIRTRRRQAYEKAPMDKIARGGVTTVRWLYESLIRTRTLMARDGTSREGVDGAFKRVMPLPVWNH
jgi:hypothetical protein